MLAGNVVSSEDLVGDSRLILWVVTGWRVSGPYPLGAGFSSLPCVPLHRAAPDAAFGCVREKVQKTETSTSSQNGILSLSPSFVCIILLVGSESLCTYSSCPRGGDYPRMWMPGRGQGAAIEAAHQGL